MRLWQGQYRVTRTDAFLTFNINTEGGNPLIGSGVLDGNGIPPDFFSDEHVRRAFNYCFDWETYIAEGMAGEGVQSIGVALPGMPGYEADGPVYSTDLEKCAEEFQASTLTSPDGQSLWDIGFRIQVAYNTGNTQRQTIAEILAANLAAVNEKFLVEIIGLPWPTFLRAQRASTLPVFFSGWVEDIHDPHNWYVPYLTGTYGRRQSMPQEIIDEFQELINQGVTETDPAARNEIYSQLNQRVYELAPQIILGIPTGRNYTQRWVQGFFRNPIHSQFYYYPFSKE
jgi:peptide/nickel transport system substrate-binding protein